MTIKDLKKLPKSKLFAMQKDIDKKLKQIKSKEPFERYEYAKLQTIQKQIKRCLCECLYCTKSKTITKTKNGEEYEYLIRDCGKPCVYIDFFKDQSQSDEEIEKKLKNLLK